MRLGKVLEKLEELLGSWGLMIDDWVVCGEYAWLLQNYKILFRKRHIDVYVNRFKWPWKTESNDISCYPPPKSLEFEQMRKFIKETGFYPHFLPCPIKMKYQPPEELRKNSIFYKLPNGKRIRVYKISKDFEERTKTLLAEDLSTWKEETAKRWLDYFSALNKIAKRKGDLKMVKISQKALEKLKGIWEEFKLKPKEEIPSKVSQIKGEIAFPGKVKGKVRVVFSANGLKKFKKGEILATPMTNPDFILAIDKAKAIVTDDGGIGCHAAIIAREFKIPCIIGTKIATKVLKNGDLIEVNAKKGIVKKLNEEKEN